MSEKNDKDKDKDKSDVKQKEWERLAAMIEEAKRHREIAKAQEAFEPLYRSIRQGKNQHKVKRPSVEDVAIAQGIIKVRSSLEEQKQEADL